jgi:hypothetical protein
LETLDKAAATGRKVHFDLTHVEDLANILAGKGKFANTVTAQELRHITPNWEFKDIFKIYIDSKVVQPSWVK